MFKMSQRNQRWQG